MRYEIEQSWLADEYVGKLRSVVDIANDIGCSTHNIKKKLSYWGIKRGKAAIVNKPSWNKGLTREADERVERYAKSKDGSLNPMFGKKAWNKGVGVEDERVFRMTAAMRKGFDSEETRLKMSAAKTGLRGEDTNNWGGGVWKPGGSGYIQMTKNGVRHYLHRYVAETAIGRKLLTIEEVHHVDMNRENNEPENLLVIRARDHTALHSAMSHERIENQVEWLVNNNIWHLEIGKIEDKKHKTA